MTTKTFKDTVLRISRKDLKQNLQTSYPAIILDSSNYQATQTITVQPNIQIEYEDGQIVRIPVIYDVPVLLPSGDQCLMSFPLKPGNVVGLVFVKNSLEEFLEQQDPDFYTPVDRRYFSLSDCFALPSLFTKRNNLSPHPDNLEIKFKDIIFSLHPNGQIDINNSSGTIALSPNGQINISNNSGYLSLLTSGIIEANGAQITADGDFISATGISLNSHTHEAGAALIGNLGNPVTGTTGGPL